MLNAKTVKNISAILYILLIFNVVFIWGNSFLDKAESSKTSSKVVEIAKPILEPVVGKGNVTEHFVRKMAHFIEFCSLGIILALMQKMRGKINLQSILNSLYFGLIIALADETIQIFSGRGSQVQDVWLDFFGTAVGFFIITLIFSIVAVLKKRTDEK